MHESALSVDQRTSAGTPRPAGLADTASARQAPRWLWRLGSPRLSIAAIVWLAFAVAWSFDQSAAATAWLAGPCALTVLNLVAAVFVRGAFRTRPALLVFHLCLIAIVLLLVGSRLTYLRGQAELAQGEVFQGNLVAREAGPWHTGDLAAQRFVSEGFEIDYAAGRRRAQTRHQLRRLDRPGLPSQIIGDDEPLVLGGYRFYTSANKGFAPRLRWRPAGGAETRGSVHLPPYPVYESAQAAQWAPAGLGRELTLELLIDGPLIEFDRASAFRMPAQPRLRVRDGEHAQVLAPGQSMTIAGGTLVFESLVTWMGYTIDYDPLAPWLLAAGLLACLSIGAHVVARWRADPWNPA